MHFPVSGVDCPLYLPPLIAFVVSALTAPAGLSGAFLLLPLQVRVLGFSSPAVTPTNLLYNLVATPGGIYRYLKEGRVAWPLVWTLAGGTVPGILMGAAVRLRYLPDPRAWRAFVALVLLYFAGRFLYDFASRPRGARERATRAEDPLRPSRPDGSAGPLPPGAAVKTSRVSLARIELEFAGERYSFRPVAVAAPALLVGVIGGIYGMGGGALLAPYLVAVVRLPVYTVAGATLFGTFLTSAAGIISFELLGQSPLGGGASVRPDWALGALFGAGGLLGTYAGARWQRYLPERWIRLILGLAVTALALDSLRPLFF